MDNSDQQVLLQSGVIPYRIDSGQMQLLIITTSSGKSWTIPKGIIDPGETAISTAEKESWEEAGIRGIVMQPGLGSYRISKWGKLWAVELFAMQVTEIADCWPESHMRKRRWLPPAQAAAVVKHRDLGALMETAAARIARDASAR